MTEYRLQRVAEAYRNELSKLLVSELTDPVFEGVYITIVKLSNDLGLADCYFSLTKDREFADEVKKAFEHKRKFIRHELARAVNIRHVPDFRFFYDETEALQEKIDQLLHGGDHGSSDQE